MLRPNQYRNQKPVAGGTLGRVGPEFRNMPSPAYELPSTSQYIMKSKPEGHRSDIRSLAGPEFSPMSILNMALLSIIIPSHNIKQPPKPLNSIWSPTKKSNLEYVIIIRAWGCLL